MEILSVISSFVLLTVPATVMLCRYRVSHEKRVGNGTAFSGALTAPVLFAIFLTFVEPDLWDLNDPKGPGVRLLLIFFALLAAVSFLPSVAVVKYYRKRTAGSLKDC